MSSWGRGASASARAASVWAEPLSPKDAGTLFRSAKIASPVAALAWKSPGVRVFRLVGSGLASPLAPLSAPQATRARARAGAPRINGFVMEGSFAGGLRGNEYQN